MPTIIINTAREFNGIIEVPGDKSISHRAVMLGSIAEGITEIRGFLMGEDCLRTIEAFRKMGIDIRQRTENREQKTEIAIHGKGLRGLSAPNKELYLGNSGTTMRIILGILAGQDFECTLSGDESLSKRPMKRVSEPLSLMGATITPKTKNRIPPPKADPPPAENIELFPPLTIKGKYPLKPIKYKLPVASAQVKSALLLAGLYSNGTSEIEEPLQSRDHTERMLKEFSADINIKGSKLLIKSSKLIAKGFIDIPGDISSAAFFMVAAAISKSSKITIKNSGINPTRIGIIDVLKRMGAKLAITNEKRDYFEPTADITVEASALKGATIEADMIPKLIDELPVIMVAAVFSKGSTVIKGASELRVKETDRIVSMLTNLKRMGADIKTEGDDIIIKGSGTLTGAEVDSFGDHRTAMSMAVAGLRAKGKTTILNTDCIDKSFPEFERLFGACCAN